MIRICSPSSTSTVQTRSCRPLIDPGARQKIAARRVASPRTDRPTSSLLAARACHHALSIPPVLLPSTSPSPSLRPLPSARPRPTAAPQSLPVPIPLITATAHAPGNALCPVPGRFLFQLPKLEARVVLRAPTSAQFAGPKPLKHWISSHLPAAPLTIMPPGSNAHPSSAHHRSKRPCQPPITSFFTPYDFGDSSESDSERGPGSNTRRHISTSGPKHQHHPHQRLQQQLPGSVQANLLSVGMRVRKSVPEGYKTHKTMSLPSIQTTLTMSPNGTSTTTMTTVQEYSVKPPRDPVPAQVQHQRELLPFCGLQKIGGYAEQPVTNVHLYGGADASGERALNVFPLLAEAFSQPFGSQSSTSSSISNTSLQAPNPANLHKRSWQDEDEVPARLSSNFLFKIPVKVSEDEVPISPLSATPPNGFSQPPLRPFAQPRTRRSGLRAADVDGMIVKDMDMDMDLENANITEARVVVESPNDFDDAEFLQPWGVGREVDMSGI